MSVNSSPDVATIKARLAMEAKVRAGVRACERCALRKGHTPVPWSGPTGAEWVFVGEAPGEEENRLGKPFAGRAGETFNALLGLAGLTRDDVGVLNVVSCRPESEGNKNRPPTADEILSCALNFKAQLDLFKKAKTVVLMGATAMKGAGVAGSVTSMRGKRVGCYYVTLHPAAGLRSPTYLKQLREDFKVLRVVVPTQVGTLACDPYQWPEPFRSQFIAVDNRAFADGHDTELSAHVVNVARLFGQDPMKRYAEVVRRGKC